MKAFLHKFRKRYKTPIGFSGIIFLLLVTFSFAMFQGGFVSWFLFYSVLPLVLYSITMAFYPIQRLKVERYISKTKLMAGEEIEVTIVIKRRSNFPLFYVVLEDLLPEVLLRETRYEGNTHQIQSRILLLPLFRKNLEFSYTINPAPRGLFKFDQIQISTGDIFGFVLKSTSVSVQDQIFVYPQYQDIERWEAGKMLQSGMKKVGKRSFSDYTSTVSVRDYVAGDRMNWLHWKASARSNKLLTKVFEQQRNDDFVIVLDHCEKSYGTHDWLFERGVSLAASIVHYAISKGGSIGYHPLSGKEIPMNIGTDQEWRILHELAKVKSDVKLPFEERLKQEYMAGFMEGKTALIISPNLSEYTMKTLELIASRQQTNVIFFYLALDSKLKSQELTYISRIRQFGVLVTPMIGSDFNESLKAGGTYASI
ncbi:DUF58 domain-containing protein [Fictibacillus sp. 18YEL24]|uniref:DUF58 domain-containing protein n=1 Tax=Fictibacillus sp. 18YEL24 TaxID=2745875 RepID=UPI0018CDF6AA|nr:DUF58 domain-containing protein [Fictibacillus sp. 18YEL24]MBH0171657.1 DUF58 domain-containing protein [Fictibacillus sp. 18YEL24]